MDMSIYHIVKKINNDAKEVAYSRLMSKVFIWVVGCMVVVQVWLGVLILSM